ncbi:response regulator [Paenibacillus sp. J5C_2022]|uniref:response regulator transcription factor n=1 Tax=Paenibacillus sp. J5C2022 TaxID=2977129 RepID=UPI0021D37086|nr:response regulator [Paenibacillus sp. J5C2022]MCU6712729.1 response regulator [Paenibacillus sp. J5C2022]
MNVIVVDDDHLIRNHIVEIIDWQSLGCTVVGQAEDGVAALKLLSERDVDLLITDIRMPGMDGLELIRRSKAVAPQLSVLLLSAYNEFDYAKQAMKLGVSDFITKPFLPSELIECVRYVKTHSLEGNSEWIRQDETIQMLQNPECSKEEKEQRLDKVGLLARPVTMLALEIDNIELLYHSGMPFSKLALRETVINLLKEFLIHHWAVLSQEGLHVYVFSGPDMRENEFRDLLFEAARQLLKLCNERFSYSISIGISRLVPSLLYLEDAVKEVRQCLDYRILLGKGSIISYEAIISADIWGKVGEREWNLVEIQRMFKSGSDVDVSLFIRNCYKETLQKGMSKQQVQRMVSDLLDIAENILLDYSVEYNWFEIRKTVMQFNVLSDLLRYLEEQLKNMTVAIREQIKDPQYRIVLQVQNLIKFHYHEEITLQMIAERLYMNYSYLSRILKQKSGKSFRELLWSYRIEMAKKLLAAGDKKAFEVAYEVGFKDPAHFSQLFKKHVGVNPMEHAVLNRQQLLERQDI